MKKNNLLKLFLGASILVFGITSCNKCQTCEAGNDEIEVCRDDANSKSEYNDAIDVLEALGYNCK